MTRILAFAGSTRTDSFNKKLARLAADAAREAGAEVTLIDLRDHPMPLYDGDLEEAEGIPEAAASFKALLKGHQTACLTLKTLDWKCHPRPKHRLRISSP